MNPKGRKLEGKSRRLYNTDLVKFYQAFATLTLVFQIPVGRKSQHRSLRAYWSEEWYTHT